MHTAHKTARDGNADGSGARSSLLAARRERSHASHPPRAPMQTLDEATVLAYVSSRAGSVLGKGTILKDDRLPVGTDASGEGRRDEWLSSVKNSD